MPVLLFMAFKCRLRASWFKDARPSHWPARWLPAPLDDGAKTFAPHSPSLSTYKEEVDTLPDHEDTLPDTADTFANEICR